MVCLNVLCLKFDNFCGATLVSFACDPTPHVVWSQSSVELCSGCVITCSKATENRCVENL